MSIQRIVQKWSRRAWPGVVVAVGAVVLAAEPVWWLIGTWSAPAYDSAGGWIFGITAALFGWSITSKTNCDQRGKTRGRHHRQRAWWLLMGTAVVRLVGRVLAIHVLGAAALAIDVYAIGVLCGLSRRKRPVSPLWLAALFGCSLPVERIFQRLIGYGLQHVSAAGSCSLLGVVFDRVACAGVHIQLAGKDVLVDLPCSGARGLVVLAVLFCILAALARPSRRQALEGVGLALVTALVANSVRIAALAVGIGFPEVVGVDVTAQPLHDLIGLAALAFGVTPLVWWARKAWGSRDDRGDGVSDVFRILSRRRRRARQCGAACGVPDEMSARRATNETPDRHHIRQILGPLLFVAAIAAVLSVSPSPVDVAESTPPIELPATLAGHSAVVQPLSDPERGYFTRFGGAAAKASYGPNTLLVVRTSAPLRHLHAPDACLSGAGWEVGAAGITGQALAGATYRATAPDASKWRVVVTYVSDTGAVATSISEAVWMWLQHPDSTWTALERIYPAAAGGDEAEAFDRSVARAFDLTDQQSSPVDLNPHPDNAFNPRR